MAIIRTSVLAICASLMTNPSLVAAQSAASPSEATVMEWVKAEWARSADPLALPGMQIDIDTIENYPPVDPAKLEAMRREVEGHPDHPKRWEIQQIEHEAATSGKIGKNSLWLWSTNNWRANSTSPLGSFFDVVVTPDVAWQLNPTQLQIYDPGATRPGQDPAAFRFTWANLICVLHFGGFNGDTPVSLAPVSVHKVGDRWSMEAKGSNGLIIKYLLKWDATNNRAFVEEYFDSIPSDTTHDEDRRVVLSDWKKIGPKGLWFASRATFTTTQGFTSRIMNLSQISECSNEQFAALTAVPTPAGTDPARGTPTFKSVYDYRPNVARATELHGDTQRDFAIAPIQRPTSATTWRLYGWAVLAIAVVCLVSIRYARRSRRSAQ